MSGPQSSVVLAPLPSIEQVAAQFSPAKSAGNEALQAAIDSTPPVEAVSEPVIEEAVTEEASAPEPAVEEPAEEKRDPLAGKFAAIARRERELRQREKEYQDRTQQEEARAKELKAKEERLQTIKKSPLKALKELGVSWQDIIDDSVGSYAEKPVDPIDARFTEVEQKLSKIDKVEEELNKRFQVLQDKEQAVALNEVKQNIREVAKDEKYELIQSLGEEAVDLVKDVMAEYFHEHKKFLDYSEACDIVEKWYEDNYLSKFATTKKVKTRFTSPAQEATKTAPKQAPVKKEAKEPTSLTNALNPPRSEVHKHKKLLRTTKPLT
jgi:hypothetical protein